MARNGGRSMMAKRALVAAYAVPQQDRDAGSKRIFDIITFLQADGWDVTFVASEPIVTTRDARAIRQRGVSVFHGDAATFDDLLHAGRFGLAVLGFWPTAELYLPAIRRVSPSTRIILDSVDLHFLRHARRMFGAGRLLDQRFGDELIGELNTYAAADAVLAVSAKEAATINDLLGDGDAAHVVPLAEGFPRLEQPFHERQGMLFVGSFRHAPNRDAVGYLCAEILPRLQQEILARHPIYIVGDALDARIASLAAGRPDVRMVGWVPTLIPYFERARISVVPLLSGAGTKQKMIQALMLGTPVVSTSVGTEGLDLVDGRDVLVADDPERFAGRIETLLQDEPLWTTLAENGRMRAEAAYGHAAAQQALYDVVDAIMAREPKGPVIEETGPKHHHERLVNQYHLSLLRPQRETRIPGTGSTAADTPSPGKGARIAPGADRERAPAEDVRLIAFFLPQFHPIPENDKWWGAGFTEWTNVAKARPLFPGHEQPRIPVGLGYYNLGSADVRRAQAELAATHGIDGFAYYHYWFNGKRLLERPFRQVLESGEPDFPFCLCWANEPWSRRWDGSQHQVLQAQHYSAADDLAHIRELLPALADSRAIRVAGRPLLLIYQGWALPDAASTIETWRDESLKAGVPDPYLVAVETGWDEGWDATQVGFDAKVLFQPQFTTLRSTPKTPIPDAETLSVYDYETASKVLGSSEPASYRTYETVFPSWDNTPRMGRRGVVIHGSSPDAYERWLRAAMDRARALPAGERLVFINAWNEWGEGAHLEPDARNGSAYLEATRRAITGPVSVG